MEHQKILNILNEANNSKFVTRKWNTVNDNSKANYNAGNEIIYNTKVLKYNLCDYNNAYILVSGDIIIAGCNLATEGAFKNCATFTKCITKIDETTKDDAENLDLVLPIYNLIEYSSNYSKTTGSLWFYSKDEVNNFNNNIVNTNNFKSFKYKTKLFEDTVADGVNGILKDATIAVSLINCKVQLKLKWIKNSVLSVAGNENESDKNINKLITLFLLLKTQNYMSLL